MRDSGLAEILSHSAEVDPKRPSGVLETLRFGTGIVSATIGLKQQPRLHGKMLYNGPQS